MILEHLLINIANFQFQLKMLDFGMKYKKAYILKGKPIKDIILEG